MTQTTVLGCDPAAGRIAFMVRHPLHPTVVCDVLDLPKPYKPITAGAALDGVADWLARLDTTPHRVAYVEAPVVGRAGVWATQVQSFVSGVIQACLTTAGFDTYLVNVSTWKKHLCGTSKADKDQVARAVEARWPKVYAVVRNDGDLIDAAGITIFGVDAVTRSKQVLT